jgi:hypothetical protein
MTKEHYVPMTEEDWDNFYRPLQDRIHAFLYDLSMARQGKVRPLKRVTLHLRKIEQLCMHHRHNNLSRVKKPCKVCGRRSYLEKLCYDCYIDTYHKVEAEVII